MDHVTAIFWWLRWGNRIERYNHVMVMPETVID
jgi:hypothetical protein